MTGSLPRGLDGGVAHISICRRNGKVLRIFHDK
ncbi:NTF2 fold immunity protein [Novosphingobium subterraneum]